ncbi:MAG: hypothetical protein B7Y99_00190 [Caulobacterales bacterium 32-69-10]|nr:MAG: hypothetical protein B7Y99_00190 [Caulobacterales bacterium 32-69-10]
MASPAAAASLDLKIELPRLALAEYHRPYVAIWIEGPAAPPRTVALWYDADNHEDGGRKWLAEMRQWWRKGGRSLGLPTDGVTGATRAPGPQTLTLAANHPALANLPAGQYQLAVEAVREKGGEETAKIAFQWPPKAPQTASAKGSTELGTITLNARP